MKRPASHRLAQGLLPVPCRRLVNRLPVLRRHEPTEPDVARSRQR